MVVYAPSDYTDHASDEFGLTRIKVERADAHEWCASELADSAAAAGAIADSASVSAGSSLSGGSDWPAFASHDAEEDDSIEIVDMSESEDDREPDATADTATSVSKQLVAENAWEALQRELSDWLGHLPVCQNADPTVVSGVIRALVASEASLSILSDFAVSELVEIGIPADFARGIHDALAVAPTDPQVNPNRASHARTQRFPKRQCSMVARGTRERVAHVGVGVSPQHPAAAAAGRSGCLRARSALSRARFRYVAGAHAPKTFTPSKRPYRLLRPQPPFHLVTLHPVRHTRPIANRNGQVARLVEEGQRRGLDMRACIERQVLWPSSLFLGVVCKSEFYATHCTWAESVVWQDLVELLCRPISAP